MRLLPLVFLAISAGAQTTSSHNGWNFADTLQSATDVIVADIVSGSAVDTGSQVTIQARLHAIRVLSGGIVAGTDLQLEWKYRPNSFEPPAITAKVPQVRGLWFLKQNDAGSLEPLQAGFMTPLGGSFLPLGTETPAYSETEPLQTKIAREIGAALEEIAAQHGADLEPHRPEATATGAPPEWVKTRNAFRSLEMALQSLDAAGLEVYRHLSGLPDPFLEAVGVFGRLRGGDISAVFDLEKNLPGIVSTFDALNPAPPVLSMGLDLSKDPRAAHALARIALSETPLPGIEGGLAFALARTRRPEFVPYLMALLDSPEAGVRDSALMSFCPLLNGSDFWIPSMAGSCPDHSPLNDPDLEHRDIQFWKEWWAMHRDDVGRAVTLPQVTTPARYGGKTRSGFQQISEVPIEVRFETLLHMVEASAPGNDPVSPQLSPADRGVFLQAIDVVKGQLAGIQAAAKQMLDAARIAGTSPDQHQSRALNAKRVSVLKTGLDQLQAKLTPQGWQTVTQFLENMRVGMVRLGAQ